MQTLDRAYKHEDRCRYVMFTAVEQNRGKNSSVRALAVFRDLPQQTHTHHCWSAHSQRTYANIQQSQPTHTHTHTDSLAGTGRGEGEPRAKWANTDLWTPAHWSYWSDISFTFYLSMTSSSMTSTSMTSTSTVWLFSSTSDANHWLHNTITTIKHTNEWKENEQIKKEKNLNKIILYFAWRNWSFFIVTLFS